MYEFVRRDWMNPAENSAQGENLQIDGPAVVFCTSASLRLANDNPTCRPARVTCGVYSKKCAEKQSQLTGSLHFEDNFYLQ